VGDEKIDKMKIKVSEMRLLRYSAEVRLLEREKNKYIRFEVFTAVVMKSIDFWDKSPFSPLSVNRRFGETSRPSSGPKK
jgi:hypothetical protein